MNTNKVYTTGQIAKICGVNFRTVIRWIKNGKIEAYALPGRGDKRVTHQSLVKFMNDNSIPLESLENDSSDDAIEPIKKVYTANDAKEILIVDDDENLLSSLKRILSIESTLKEYKITTISNSFKAGEYLSNQIPSIVLLDLSMPGMTGFDIIRHIRGKNKEVKIIVISAMPDHDLQKAINEGADLAVKKPYDAIDLTAKILEALDA